MDDLDRRVVLEHAAELLVVAEPDVVVDDDLPEVAVAGLEQRLEVRQRLAPSPWTTRPITPLPLSPWEQEPAEVAQPELLELGVAEEERRQDRRPHAAEHGDDDVRLGGILDRGGEEVLDRRVADLEQVVDRHVVAGDREVELAQHVDAVGVDLVHHRAGGVDRREEGRLRREHAVAATAVGALHGCGHEHATAGCTAVPRGGNQSHQRGWRGRQRGRARPPGVTGHGPCTLGGCQGECLGAGQGSRLLGRQAPEERLHRRRSAAVELEPRLQHPDLRAVGIDGLRLGAQRARGIRIAAGIETHRAGQRESGGCPAAHAVLLGPGREQSSKVATGAAGVLRKARGELGAEQHVERFAVVRSHADRLACRVDGRRVLLDAQEVAGQVELVALVVQLERLAEEQVLAMGFRGLAELGQHLAEQEARVVVLRVLGQHALEPLLGAGDVPVECLLDSQQVVLHGGPTADLAHQPRHPQVEQHEDPAKGDHEKDLQQGRLGGDRGPGLPPRALDRLSGRRDGHRRRILRHRVPVSLHRSGRPPGSPPGRCARRSGVLREGPPA